MSSSRHGAPLIMYSDSPVRNSVRVIVTSENSIGSSRAVLSIVSETSARPSAGRSAVPAKMTSSIFAAAQRPRALRAEHPRDRVDDVRLARPVRADDDADAGLELERGLVGEGLEALQRQRLEEQRGPPLRAPIVGAAPPARGGPARTSTRPGHRHRMRNRRSPIGRNPVDVRRASTRARGGPDPAPRDHAVRPPRPDLRTRPRPRRRRGCGPNRATRSARARSRHASRNQTPCTRPVATTRTRTGRADADGSVTPDTPRSRRSSGWRSAPGARRAGSAGTPGPRGRTPGGGAGTRPGVPKRSTYCSSASDEPRYFTASCSVSKIAR